MAPKKSSTPINNSIKASQVMLIDQNGKKQGILSIDEALIEANKVSLDLVQVSASDANPVVCKLLDYGNMYLKRKKIYLLQKLSLNVKTPRS